MASDVTTSFTKQSLEAQELEDENNTYVGTVTVMNEYPPSRLDALTSSWWHWATPNGLSGKRTIKMMPKGSYFMGTAANAKKHCKSKDKYGSNDCTYAWGESVKGSIVFDLGIKITEDHEIKGKFTVDKFLKWEFSCTACGGACAVKLLNKQMSFQAPACSALTNNSGDRLTIPFDHALPDVSPLGVTMKVVGSLHLVAKSAPTKVLAELDMDFTMK